MPSSSYKWLIILLVVAFMAFMFKLFPRYACVETVLNGDTLLLTNGTLIKLIGVSTPESNHPEAEVRNVGIAAADFTQKMVEGKKIWIAYHHRHDNQDMRALASVYLMNGTYVNAEIIRQGYGRADTDCRSRDAKFFQQLERQARENKRGLWAALPQ